MWLYLGYADLAAVGAELATLPANGLLVAGAHCGYEGLEAFARRFPPTDSSASAWSTCSTRASRPKTRSASASLTVSAARAAERLWVVPDGGFRALRAETARAKLAAMVAAAK